ncbi:MAG TPA: GDSL-type esterase/lipase family protein [Granulicella sp.]
MDWKPRQWALVGILLAMIGTISPPLAAQVTTTEIADTVYRADGSAASGTVVISWPEFMTATDQSVPAGSTAVVIGADGALDVRLAPNAGSNPMGSYYTAVYHLDDGSISRQYWVIPASGSAVKISTVSSTVLPMSVAQQTVSKSYVDTAIAQAITGTGTGSTTGDATEYVLKAGDTMTGPLVLPGDPTAATQAADKHYVDTTAQQLATGLGQKVSQLPTAGQTVVQPTGTQLSVNHLNGELYASQYVDGTGNNGIANAVASTDCASGCEVKADNSYASTEGYAPSNWSNQTHVEDTRQGSQTDSYINPGSVTQPGSAIAQTARLVTSQNPAVVNQTVIASVPNAIVSSLSHQALAGGSNLFPQTIEGTVPYFKSNYSVQQLTGNYNAAGQHSLDGERINCYGVGDCLIGGKFLYASGGLRDEADEGAHAYDQNYEEDSVVFTGTCSSGCSTGSTSVTVAVATGPGTQGEGRYLINKNPSKTISTGTLTGGGGDGDIYATATFSGTSFPVSVFFSTGAAALSQANNIAPGTVTLPIATSGVHSGFATNTAAAPAQSGIACVADQDTPGTNTPSNYEMSNYTVVDGTHLRLTLNKVHGAQSTVAIGGLCGYGIEQTIDTQNGIRQVFPVIGSYSAMGLYYAAHETLTIGRTGQTGAFLNLSSTIATVSRSNNVVTLTATGNFPADINGLTMTVAGVADSSYNGTFTVTTTGTKTLTYTQTGADSTSTGGTLSILTGDYVLYPIAEVLSVMNPSTKQVDGQMALAPNTVAWASGDPVEEPHYFEESVSADRINISQTMPRPSTKGGGGIYYRGNLTNGVIGWVISNLEPATSYMGSGGMHFPPFAAYVANGVWNSTMDLVAGQQSVFAVHCNAHGCGQWNSGYDLFELNSNVGGDTVHYDPLTSTLNFGMRGTNYQLTPQALTAGTINATTLNATTINGSVSGSSIASGTVSAARLPMLGASGSGHAAGIAPDPGATAGTTRFLREDGTWSVPAGGGGSAAGSATLAAGATADYNFLEGTGTTVNDTTGNGNNATFGANPPAWTTAGLSFIPKQGVSLPTALNGTQTFFVALYINPLSAGPQPYTNTYSPVISSSLGSNGFSLLTALDVTSSYLPNAFAPSLFVNGAHATSSQTLLSGFHVLAVTLGSGSAKDHLYIDGVEVGSYIRQTTSASAQTSGNLYLGSSGINPWDASGLYGTVYRMRTYATALPSATVQMVSNSIAAEVASRGIATKPVPVPMGAPRIHAVGDSITYGQGVSTPWPSLLSLTSLTGYATTDWGISGIMVAALAASEPNRVAPQCSSGPGSPSQIAIVFAGTNDLSGGFPETLAFQNLLAEVHTLKQAGCKVFVGTMISRGGTDGSASHATIDSDKNVFNAQILQQAKSFEADSIVDFAANPLLGADGASTNTTYFQADQTHPTQAGQALLAAAASNVLNYYFGYSETNPHVVTTLGYSMTAADGYISLSGLTGAGALTLPDCTGQSGAGYRINNPQSAYAVTVAPLNGNQLINGLSTVTVPANATLLLRDVPNPKTTAGCHWEM